MLTRMLWWKIEKEKKNQHISKRSDLITLPDPKQSDSMTNIFICRHLNRTITEDFQQQQQQQQQKTSAVAVIQATWDSFKYVFSLEWFLFLFCTSSYKLWFSFVLHLVNYSLIKASTQQLMSEKSTPPPPPKKKRKKRVDGSHASKSHSQHNNWN